MNTIKTLALTVIIIGGVMRQHPKVSNGRYIRQEYKTNG